MSWTRCWLSWESCARRAAGGIEVDDAEDATHGGGLAGAVGVEEAGHASGKRAEIAALGGDDIAEAFVEAGEFKRRFASPREDAAPRSEAPPDDWGGRGCDEGPGKSHRRFSVFSEFS
jgi:hypothetical protein